MDDGPVVHPNMDSVVEFLDREWFVKPNYDPQAMVSWIKKSLRDNRNPGAFRPDISPEDRENLKNSGLFDPAVENTDYDKISTFLETSSDDILQVMANVDVDGAGLAHFKVFLRLLSFNLFERYFNHPGKEKWPRLLQRVSLKLNGFARRGGMRMGPARRHRDEFLARLAQCAELERDHDQARLVLLRLFPRKETEAIALPEIWYHYLRTYRCSIPLRAKRGS